MGLNKSKGNMYEFVTHTWNTVKGRCPHDCSYCYMKRWGDLKKIHLDEKELKADLGSGNFIFVGSSCDMFANDVSESWILKTLNKCGEHDNSYLFQSKNPERMSLYKRFFPPRSKICATIETNRWYPEIMAKSPRPEDRARWMGEMIGFDRYVTIEPIMDFDLVPFVDLIKSCEPTQVNIGADSGNNGLPEPPAEKILELIDHVSRYASVVKKRNLGRIEKHMEAHA